MKKNILFIIFFLLSGCTSETPVLEKISCPKIMFSAEHNKYISSDINQPKLDDLNYKAEINNFNFNEDCSLDNQIFQTKLSLLFVIEPLKVNEVNINLPFYIAALNERDKLIDIQYFNVDGNFSKINESGDYIETEIIETLDLRILISKDQNINILVVGFMLSEEKLDLLN